MKVFTCDDFKGHYPVGTAAVVVADDIHEARKLLLEELNKISLAQPGEFTLNQLFTSKPRVIILNDGNY